MKDLIDYEQIEQIQKAVKSHTRRLDSGDSNVRQVAQTHMWAIGDEIPLTVKITDTTLAAVILSSGDLPGMSIEAIRPHRTIRNWLQEQIDVIDGVL